MFELICFCLIGIHLAFVEIKYFIKLLKKEQKMRDKSKKKLYHLTSNFDKGWKAKKRGASRASGNFNTKADAVERGKELAKSGTEGQIIIHKKGGKFQTEYTYQNDPFPPKG